MIAPSRRKSPSANSANCIVAEREAVVSKAKLSKIEYDNWCMDKRFEIIPILPHGIKYRWERDDSAFIAPSRTHFGII